MFTLKNFYKSDKWRSLINQLRLERVSHDGILYCVHCDKPIVKAYDCIGHHIDELTEANVNDYSISLNPDNIILIHHRCHNIIHERFGHEKPKQVFLVYGAPCSGKTTWVHDNAGPDDLILDIDNIWEMITVNERYVKRDRLKSNVFAIRDCILDQIKIRNGKWKNAYIIGGYPLRMDRDRMEHLYGCQPVFIDEPYDVCISRAKNNEWKKYIDEWFDNYIA